MLFLHGRISPNMTQTIEIFANQNSFPGKIPTNFCGIDSAVNIPKDVENSMETMIYIHADFSISSMFTGVN